MKIFLKICGITNVEDAKFIVSMGVNALGIIRYKKSPRFVNDEDLIKISKVVPSHIKLVPVFVNEEQEIVKNTLSLIPGAIPQFHGKESPEYCESFGTEYIKAVIMDVSIDLSEKSNQYHSCKALLLDSKDKSLHGGTGKVFDWDLVNDYVHKPLILAGGLNIENIDQALSSEKYWGVDVSSGVESSPEKKDHRKVSKFIKKVRNKDD